MEADSSSETGEPTEDPEGLGWQLGQSGPRSGGCVQLESRR